MNLTIDASVFVSSVRPSEKLYSVSFKFLQSVRGTRIFCPTLVIPECGAAIARPTGNSILSRKLVSLVERFPGMNQVPLDRHLAHRAALIAIDHRLRSADAVYVAVASVFDAALISWDEEMLERCPDFVMALSPEKWLEKAALNRSGSRDSV